MFGLYTQKDVRRLVQRIRQEYEGAIEQQKRMAEELKEQNRILAARVSELENERKSVADALILAVSEGERVKRENSVSADNERKELLLLSEKCRLLSEKLSAEYPDKEDVAAFAEFVQSLRERLGESGEGESGFNMDDVLAPKEPLDLGKLCRDLGLMEEDE